MKLVRRPIFAYRFKNVWTFSRVYRLRIRLSRVLFVSPMVFDYIPVGGTAQEWAEALPELRA